MEFIQRKSFCDKFYNNVLCILVINLWKGGCCVEAKIVRNNQMVEDIVQTVNFIFEGDENIDVNARLSLSDFEELKRWVVKFCKEKGIKQR